MDVSQYKVNILFFSDSTFVRLVVFDKCVYENDFSKNEPARICFVIYVLMYTESLVLCASNQIKSNQILYFDK